MITKITICIITFCIPLHDYTGGDRIEGDGAFQTLTFHGAGHLIRACYVSIGKQIGGGAPPAAIKSGPALPAGGTGVDILLGKLTRDFHIEAAAVDIAHTKLLFPHKLVAGEIGRAHV